ncbi:hypothetical protein BDW62DRAFT_174708 [Aspergillus aurantiobrunneus]
MPPRRPVSPLALETCSPLDSDLDDYGLEGSDDELDESQRSAQHRRAEKLGEAYLKGNSLFILSASLRGPLDKDWVNPWKKNRRKTTASKRDNGPTGQPVIPETNSRKRRHHQSPPASSRSKSSTTRQVLSRTDGGRGDARRIDCTDQAPGFKPTAVGSESPRFTRYKPADVRWLKKDKASTGFQNIDPPTSPTTSISSRQLKKGGTTSSQSIGPPGTEYKSTNRSFFDEGRPTPESTLQEDGSQGDGSVHVVSSSSQLPKFEYRLKQHGKSATDAENRLPEPSKDNHSEVGAVGISEIPVKVSKNPPQKSPSIFGAECDQMESHVARNTRNSLTLMNASNTIENPPSAADLNKRLPSNPTNDSTSENNIPSAQHVPRDPAPWDNLTSLYSIAVSKATSNRTEDHNVDQQFSTQAALLVAQRSFQNDLRSPERSPVASVRKRRASQQFNHHSPNAASITPFHKMNAPDREIADQPEAPGTERAQMISTQYMIDAATPFTFSTEKKAEFRTVSSGKDRSKGKKRKITSFALSSPSEIPSEHWTFDEDHNESVMQQQPAEARNSPSGSQQSVFPMTLTGTTPPTVHEGQAVESFNLSQAIAEAGSWLQQSFEINRDITHCQSAKLPQSYSADFDQLNSGSLL